MGAISDTIQSYGFTLTQSIHGQVITVLTGVCAGQNFVGTMLVAPNLELNTELGEDMREKTMIHFPNDAFPNVKPQDSMADSNGGKWKFVKRTDNEADATVDFELMKIVPNVDS